jgi:hypothetical protein
LRYAQSAGPSTRHLACSLSRCLVAALDEVAPEVVEFEVAVPCLTPAVR